MPSKAEVRDRVAAVLDVPPATIGDEDNLVHLGMNSISVMRLAGRWRKDGHDIRSASFLTEPTVRAWADLLADSATPTPATPVESVADGTEFPLATMQHAYWLGRRQDQRLGGVAAHLYVEFDGAGLDPERLRRAAQRLVRRHAMLRAAFLDSGHQRILPEPGLPVFHTVDLRDASPDTVAAELDRIRLHKSHQRMDVASGQAVDITVTTLPDAAHRLHVDVDMLVADAQSYRRLLDDLAALYEADDNCLAPVEATFRDYLLTKTQAPNDNTADARWWIDKIPQLPEVPALPTVPESERADPLRSIRLHHRLDPAPTGWLYANARRHGVTPAVAVATVFSEVVGRWSTRQRFLLNLPLFNREPLHDGIEDVVGDFTNSVLLDVDLRCPEPMVARAHRLQRELHSCVAHSGYEGLDVLRRLGRWRGAPVTPSVVFTSGLDLGDLFSERVSRVFGEPVWILSQGPQVDLDAQVVELRGGLLVNWDLRRDALPDGVADDMFAEFRRLLTELSEPDADWSVPLDLDLPPGHRRARGNDTVVSWGARTLHGRFFELAGDQPHRTALYWRGGTVTYRQLADRALAIAHHLTDAGVRHGDTVAVAVAKGTAQISAVLGVLAAGATYVPVDVDQPAARRNRILQLANASVALVDGSGTPPAGVTAVPVDVAAAGPRLPQPRPCAPDAIAYLLFTSGSTGEPKGVEVSHRAAANTIDAIAERFGFAPEDRTLGLSALNFDLSVYDIFAPLSQGGALVCVDAAGQRDPDGWAELIAGGRVTVLNCAPGLVTMLADTADPAQLHSLRLVLTGGDKVPTKLAQRLRSLVPGLRFVGLGGTTETAIHSTFCEVTDDGPWRHVPYGRPLAGVALRVVNERGQDCPDWVPGELWIGGAGVADGYRNDPVRTADRFVHVDGARWYRTGDMARYRPGGIVEFLGRADHQVKIRGYRVELGEVESALATLPGVEDAVAVLTETGKLAAAVRAHDRVDAATVTEGLRNLVPDYMIPEVTAVLDRLPLTANGKADRAAIGRLLSARQPAPADVPPADEVEAAIAYIVAAVLGAEHIGVATDFFEAGGDSILATTLTGQLRGLLAVPRFTVATVLEARTVRGIADALRGADDPVRLHRACTILLELADAGVPETV